MDFKLRLASLKRRAAAPPCSPQCLPCLTRTRQSWGWRSWWCGAGGGRSGRCWWRCSSWSPAQWSPDVSHPPPFSAWATQTWRTERSETVYRLGDGILRIPPWFGPDCCLNGWTRESYFNILILFTSHINQELVFFSGKSWLKVRLSSQELIYIFSQDLPCLLCLLFWLYVVVLLIYCVIWL